MHAALLYCMDRHLIDLYTSTDCMHAIAYPNTSTVQSLTFVRPFQLIQQIYMLINIEQPTICIQTRLHMYRVDFHEGWGCLFPPKGEYIDNQKGCFALHLYILQPIHLPLPDLWSVCPKHGLGESPTTNRARAIIRLFIARERVPELTVGINNLYTLYNSDSQGRDSCTCAMKIIPPHKFLQRVNVLEFALNPEVSL